MGVCMCAYVCWVWFISYDNCCVNRGTGENSERRREEEDAAPVFVEGGHPELMESSCFLLQNQQERDISVALVTAKPAPTHK